jgi:DNA-binding transcriptional ArsR family regulator
MNNESDTRHELERFHRRVTRGAKLERASSTELAPEVLARFLNALADPTRLRIVELLAREGELHVSALVERLQQPQGRVSTHLACLRTCGLVQVRQDGKYRFYTIADHRIPALLALARDLALPYAAAIATCRVAARRCSSED